MAGRASFSSSSSFSYGWNYDVFLSFRGPDTRYGFTGNLYKALHDKGIHTFFDEDGLPRGDEITPSLLKAIEESRIAIPIFSQNYAASSSCLDELVHIIDCIKAKGRLVLPVFYDVDPSVVRYQIGSYGEALAKHVEMFSKFDKEKLEDNMERLKKWKMALKEAANLSGEHFKLRNEKYEYEFIGKIVKVVSNKINRAPLHVADYPVGLESRVREVNSLLDVGSDDVVHKVGIHGIGGIGKTTLARAVYNSIADSFEGLCFLGSVRENSMKHGLVYLQEILLFKIVGEKDIKLGDVGEGIPIIKHRLHRKKVLLILDDVDNLKQLQAMVGGPDWFGPGSRVIITTRDKHLLAIHGVERNYEVDGLNGSEAIDLLIWKAFKSDKVDSSYVDILNCVVTYASRLPLALEVIGSNLFGKSVEEWESALVQYKRIPNKEIQKILKVSLDALEEDVLKIFLDIACFFNKYELAEVENILCAHYGVSMKFGIVVLVEKSLVKILFGRVTLHDLIQDMGREIVRQESPEKPGKRSRLWLHEDIVQVLEDNTGTCKIQIIILDFPKSKEVKLDGQAFKEMKSLKTLIIKNGRFSQSPKHLPNSLRVLEWWGYPSESLPYDFHPKKLVIFKLPQSCLISLKLLERKKFENLTILNVSSNDYITQIPDVSGIPNLVELSFQYCDNLIKIHESVGFLDKLRILNASGCEKLRTFPPINLTSLENLHLSYCSSLESFPEILGKMENITKLYIRSTSIKELPFSIRLLTRLQNINLEYCGFVQLPSSIGMLPKLESFSVSRCEGLQLSKQDEGKEQVSSRMSSDMYYVHLFSCNIPDEFLPNVLLTCFANVKAISLMGSNFTILPACIKECHFLKELNLDNCNNLREIRGLPPNIENLAATNCRSLTSSSRSMLGNEKLHRKGGDKMFIFPGTRIPNWFKHYSSGEPISFWFRNKFPAISLCLATEMLMNGQGGVHPRLTINGIDKGGTFHFSQLAGNDISIFDKKQIKFKDVDEVFLENEWNHVVVFYEIVGEFLMEPTVQQIGVHIFKQKCSTEDIRFTDPWEKVIKHEDTMVSHVQFMPQQQNLALLEPHVEQGREWLSLLPPPAMKSLNDNVNCNPNSMASTRISSSISVQDTFHEVKRKRDRRKENLNNRESVESRWRPGTQRRGLRGGRGNFSPHNVSQDAGSSKNPGAGKDNGAHQVTEKVAPPLPASQETISKDKNSGTSSAANGPTSVASGTTSGVSPSPSSSGSGDRMDPSSGANNNLGSALPSASSNKGATVASGSGSMPSSSNCSGSGPAGSSSPVNFSSSDPVLVPSNDLWFPVSIGAIRLEVGSQRPPGESNAVNSAENKLTAASETGSSSVQGKIQGKSQGVAKNHLTEISPTSSTITHGSSSASRPSSNYGSRSQQLSGPQKAGSNKEWKPNSTNTVNQGSGPAFASAPSVSAEVTGQLQSASSALDSEEATSKLQKKLEDFHLPQRQRVILPNHIFVPESEKNKFSFGSLGVTFGVNTSYVSGPESEKSSTPLSETSQTIEETVEEQASRL